MLFCLLVRTVWLVLLFLVDELELVRGEEERPVYLRELVVSVLAFKLLHGEVLYLSVLHFILRDEGDLVLELLLDGVLAHSFSQRLSVFSITQLGCYLVHVPIEVLFVLLLD